MKTTRAGVVEKMATTPWRYRAVSAPLTTAMATFTTGTALHALDVSTGTVATAAAVVALGAPIAANAAKLGKDAAWYTFLSTAAAGGWLTYSSATSPYTSAALSALGIGALALGPWFGVLRRWRNKSIAAQRATETREAEAKRREVWEQILHEVGLPGLRTISRHDTRAGFTVLMKTPAKGGITARRIAEARERIEVAAADMLEGQLIIRRGAIRVEPGESANDVLIHVSTRDVLAEKIELPHSDSPATVNEPFSIGEFEDGTDVEILYRYLQAWLVGMTDAGKSNTLNVLIAQFTRCVDTLVWVAAADKGIPLVSPWLKPFTEGRTNTPLLDWVATDTPECMKLLLAAYQAADIRSRTPRGGRDKITISQATPQIIVLLEEAPALLENTKLWTTHKGERRTASWIAREIVRLGRSEGVSLMPVAQRGTAGMLGAQGGDIKANIGLKIGMRTAKRDDNRWVFPDDPAIALHELVHNGSMYVKRSNDSRPMPAKAYFLEPEYRLPEVAEQHTAYRTDLEPSTARALGKDYLDRWSDERAGELMDMLRGINAPAMSTSRTTTGLQELGPPPIPRFGAASGSTAVDALGVPEIPASWKVAARKNINPSRIEDELAAFRAELDKIPTAERKPIHPVPEPLATLLRAFRNDERKFISSADLASTAGIDATTLGNALSRAPFHLRSARLRRSEYDGEPTRGYFLSHLREAGQQLAEGQTRRPHDDTDDT